METTTHEYHVSLEIAKLLEKAGFDWRCNAIYGSVGGEFNFYYDVPKLTNKNNDEYSAPTLEVAQRWMREVKHISVEPGIDVHGKWKVLCCKYPVNNEWPDNWCLLDDTDETNPSYSTYEEAVEAGIKKSLEITLEKGE